MQTSKSRTSSLKKLLDPKQPHLFPRLGEVSVHLRVPQTGRRFIFCLRDAAEYAYHLFDGALPYFGNGYDLHTLFSDILEETFYNHNFASRSFEDQLEIILEESGVEVDAPDHQNRLFEVRLRLSSLRNDIKNLIRQDIPRIQNYWHVNMKLDSSFTCWLVIE